MGAGLDGVLFSRESKGIPAHRVEDIVSAGHFVAPQNVASGKILNMSGVKTRSAWVGEHVQKVILRLIGNVRSLKCALFFPKLLPTLFNFGERIVFIGCRHG